MTSPSDTIRNAALMHAKITEWQKETPGLRRPLIDLCLEIVRALAAPQPVACPEGWKPIETAKQDHGQKILLAFADGEVAEGYWGVASYDRSKRRYVNDWVLHPNSGAVAPTHWQSLPAPPSFENSASPKSGDGK